MTGTGTGIYVYDHSVLDVVDSTIATTGSYGIQSGLGNAILIHADAGDTTEITGAQTGVFCSSSKLDLSTDGNGTILIDKNKRLGLQPWDCGVQTYNPSGTIASLRMGRRGVTAQASKRGGVAILNSVKIENSAGFAAINASLNAGMQLNNVTMSSNIAGIYTNQGAIVQFVPYNGVSTVKNNGDTIFSCYQGGQIYVDQIAGTITRAPTKAQLGCLHVGGP